MDGPSSIGYGSYFSPGMQYIDCLALSLTNYFDSHYTAAGIECHV